MHVTKEFYEKYPYPSKCIASYETLYRNVSWLTELVDKKPSEFKEHESILDAGCGTAEHTCGFALGKARVIGIDISKSSIINAKKLAKRFGLNNVKFICEDLLKVKLPKESFDYVFCIGVLHHMEKEQAEKVFEKLISWTKPNGFIVVGVYNTYARIPVKLKRFLLGLLAGNNIEKKVVLAQKLFCKKMPSGYASEIWLADKYANPLERSYSFWDIIKMFEKHNIKFYKSKPEVSSLNRISLFAEQLKWLFKGISFFTVSGRKADNKK